MDLEPRGTEEEKGSAGSVGEPLAAALASSLCFQGASQPRAQSSAHGDSGSLMEHSCSMPALSPQREAEAAGPGEAAAMEAAEAAAQPHQLLPRRLWAGCSLPTPLWISNQFLWGASPRGMAGAFQSAVQAVCLGAGLEGEALPGGEGLGST